MKRITLIRWAYLLAVVPLMLGSLVFFCWYYARRVYAIDLRIEGLSLLALLLFVLCGAVVLVLTTVALLRDRTRFFIKIGPVLLLVLTCLAIDVYGTMYDQLREKVYFRFELQGSGITEVEVWSAHMRSGRRSDPNKDDVLLSFMPVYTYDWGSHGSAGPMRALDSVFVEVHTAGAQKAWCLPWLREGECRTLTLSDLEQLPAARTMEQQHGRLGVIH